MDQINCSNSHFWSWCAEHYGLKSFATELHFTNLVYHQSYC